MRAARLLASLAILASLSGVAYAQDGCARLSWESCDPWHETGCYFGQAKYRLVYSVYGVSAPNIGTDSNIHVFGEHTCGLGPVPDAWRFDDSGCQGSGRISFSTDAFAPDCPAMKSTNQQIITNVSQDSYGELDIRLATIYDAVTPDPSKRYTLWVITFDLTHADVGPTPADHSSCGGVEEGLTLALSTAYVLRTTGFVLDLPACDLDPVFPDAGRRPFAYWNREFYICGPQSRPSRSAGNCQPVASEALTWGRVRATYR